MQLNLTTDYAIRCLLFLSSGNKNFSAKEISIFAGVSEAYTGKLLRRLRDGGLVTSKGGHNGGFEIARPLSKITLLDVMNITEDTMRINRCLEDDHFCSRNGIQKHCPVNKFYNFVQEKFISFFEGISLQDIIENY